MLIPPLFWHVKKGTIYPQYPLMFRLGTKNRYSCLGSFDLFLTVFSLGKSQLCPVMLPLTNYDGVTLTANDVVVRPSFRHLGESSAVIICVLNKA